jgi:hypothetical protein
MWHLGEILGVSSVLIAMLLLAVVAMYVEIVERNGG